MVTGYPGPGHVALALLLAGRLPPSSGRVLIDGRPGVGRRQRGVALVDAPGVTEPEPALSVAAVVGEELAIAGRKAWRSDVSSWLTRWGQPDVAHKRFEKLHPELRLAMLVELAAGSAAVEVLVLVMPDRHGVPAALIWDVATGAAAHGLAVVLTVAATTAERLPAAPTVMGTRSAADPVTVEQIEGDPVEGDLPLADAPTVEPPRGAAPTEALTPAHDEEKS